MAITRYVGLGKEAAGSFGTPVAATRYAEAISKIAPDQNWVIPPPISQRAASKRNLGPYRARGAIGDFPVEPENIIGELLHGVFGNVQSAQQGGTTAWLHTFTPADSLPSYTTRIGVELTERILPGTLIEALTIKFAHDKDIMANAEVYSGFPETKQALQVPTISALQALNMQAATCVLMLGGISKKTMVYDLEITIKNNIPFDRGQLDGRNFSVKRYGQREITGKISAFFDDTSQFDAFIAGTEFPIDVQAIGPVITGSYYYKLAFDLRKCVYLRDSVPDPKPQSEPLVIDAPFKAFYDTTGGFNAEGKAFLTNKITAY
ncbi:MAG: phage tail tube protein [Candidatus Bathyarchaeota archaeon]|nr:phage tail tube protein [Candidatus Bathyarchaeota archaeon]MDH5788097.1 phage tail tube protein [Candidatus Bathyarchaeota archaeon]